MELSSELCLHKFEQISVPQSYTFHYRGFTDMKIAFHTASSLSSGELKYNVYFCVTISIYH